MKKLLIGLMVLVALLSMPMAVSAVSQDVTVGATVSGTMSVNCAAPGTWTIDLDPDYFNASACTTTGNVKYDIQVADKVGAVSHAGHLNETASTKVSVDGWMVNQLDIAEGYGEQPAGGVWQDLTGTQSDLISDVIDGSENFDIWLLQDLAPTDVASSYSITIVVNVIAST